MIRHVIDFAKCAIPGLCHVTLPYAVNRSDGLMFYLRFYFPGRLPCRVKERVAMSKVGSTSFVYLGFVLPPFRRLESARRFYILSDRLANSMGAIAHSNGVGSSALAPFYFTKYRQR